MLPQTLFVVASALTAVTAGPVRKRAAPNSPPPRANSSTSSSATASKTTPAPPPTPPPPPPRAPWPCCTTSPPWPPAPAPGLRQAVVKPPPMTEAAWSRLADDVLHKTDLPLNIVGNALTKYAADVSAPFQPSDADLALDGLAGPPLRAIGHHYFDAAGVPTFDLFGTGQKLVAKKLNDTAAPRGADRGLLDTGAVAWLRLGDNGAGGSRGLASVYRVYTSGGASIACAEANTTISVPYTAQYWFYA
ncbi:hypothetical protein PG993_012658 [Apiospora rasikravindrae]|uniref:Uncharacterized protein n=1 Tax=Apiospora rasikravindrae TaxID=990691 RepID=A0ABR1S4C7_9PEZI